jgi:hypothetical protein
MIKFYKSNTGLISYGELIYIINNRAILQDKLTHELANIDENDLYDSFIECANHAYNQEKIIEYALKINSPTDAIINLYNAILNPENIDTEKVMAALLIAYEKN